MGIGVHRCENIIYLLLLLIIIIIGVLFICILSLLLIIIIIIIIIITKLFTVGNLRFYYGHRVRARKLYFTAVVMLLESSMIFFLYCVKCFWHVLMSIYLWSVVCTRSRVLMDRVLLKFQPRAFLMISNLESYWQSFLLLK